MNNVQHREEQLNLKERLDQPEMTRGEILDLAKRLAKSWTEWKPGDVVEKIISYPSPIAAALAILIAAELHQLQLFDSGGRFRSMMLDRALHMRR